MAVNYYVSKTSIVCITFALCLAVLVRESNARPPWLAPGSGVFKESAACHTDDELLDLCQRCAKLTKSKQALPSCCSSDLSARKWCADFVYFRIGDPN